MRWLYAETFVIKKKIISVIILELQNQKQLAEAKQVMDAFKRSEKSMQELMNFLDV